MKNAEISKILKEANNNTIYLWDLPRPQWKEEDFKLLESIKNGAKYKTNKIVLDDLQIESDIKTLCQPNRTLIKRKADGKIYNSTYECAYDNNLTRSHLMTVLRSDIEHRFKEMFEIINN
jgi:hypothetical protein